jgi:lipoprotein-anchoring transpeptidase ErfK/SrfK
MHLSVRIDRQSRRVLAVGVPVFLGVLATAAATRPEVTSSPATEIDAGNGVRVVVDLSERRLVIQDAGQAVREFGVAIGKPTHPTPTGQFTIRKMIWNPGWVPPNSPWARGKKAREPGDPRNPMQAVKIFFREPYYYIHGTNDPKSIGHAASHGCLRMTPEDAAELGAYLMEHGGQPRGETWFRRVFRFGRSTVIYLDNPIPMTITA